MRPIRSPGTWVVLRTTVAVASLLASPTGTPAAQGIAGAYQGAVVPRLVGRSYDQALHVLDSAGLQVGKLDSVRSHEAHGIVVAQSPDSGRLVPRGAKVDVKYSTGPGTNDGPVSVSVPDLSGLSPVVASFRLGLAKLETGSTDSVFDEQHVGQVFRQSPAANELVPSGTKVAFWYGFGRTATVPDVKNRDLAAASQAIADSGLKVGHVDDPQHSGGTGLIVKQSPGPGRTVPIGSEVRLTLGKSAYVLVPPLVGLSVGKANVALAAAGLLEGTVGRTPSDTTPGVVLTQAPLAGASVLRGSSVALSLAIPRADTVVPKVVTKPPDAQSLVALPVVVPRVIGSTVIGATRIVEGSGLRVVKTQHREGPGPGGRVVAQVPKPGLRVPPRSGVTLTVSVPVTAVVPALAGRTTTAATPPLVVPNLVGMRADSAEALLAHSRLRGARVDTVATSTLGGSVLRQDPPAGATVGPGTLVLLYVERGRLIALLLLAGGIATGGALSKLGKLVRHRPEPKSKPGPSLPGLMPEVWLEPHVAEGTHSVADQGQPVIHHELQLVPHAGAQHVEADEPLALEHV